MSAGVEVQCRDTILNRYTPIKIVSNVSAAKGWRVFYCHPCIAAEKIIIEYRIAAWRLMMHQCTDVSFHPVLFYIVSLKAMLKY